MEDRVQLWLDEKLDDGLRNTIRDRRHHQPGALGISTCLTDGEKYDPDDIRFHSLYRFFDRSCSKSVMVSSSMPAAPRLALTCWYASHTVRLAMP